ncbi:MAG: glucosamine-6-phosphate deaminase [Clostridia bacterium]|nr:glucosamine-6-phosphate deaminase [Clostridia bacterium]
MQKIICKDYEAASRKAAEILMAELAKKPDMNLGLPTGSTPIGMYKTLIAEGADLSKVTTFNLDEYYPILKSNDQSYEYFMRRNLFDALPPKEMNIPNGEAADPAKECLRYDAAIEAAGGLDVQVLGIGQNGHIGFNEPGDALSVGTNHVQLTENTIDANSRFFASRDEVPTSALTLGLGGIMKAKKIIMIATGKEKAKAVAEIFSGKITTQNPATVLQLHADVTVIMDEEAAANL